MAAAMIDNRVRHAEVIALNGDSYRIKDRDLGRVTGSTTENEHQGVNFQPKGVNLSVTSSVTGNARKCLCDNGLRLLNRPTGSPGPRQRQHQGWPPRKGHRGVEEARQVGATRPPLARRPGHRQALRSPRPSL